MTHWDDTGGVLDDLIKRGRVQSIGGKAIVKKFTLPADKKPNKYGNEKTVIDNITFDSKGEADYYCRLKLLKRAKAIAEFELQPSFELQPAFKHDGKTIRAIIYRADFKIVDDKGHTYYVDFKSEATEKKDLYRVKRKMLFYKYPDIDFREEYC